MKTKKTPKISVLLPGKKLRTKLLFASVASAFTIALVFNGLSQSGSNIGESLMASVGNVANNKIQEENFKANLVLRDQGKEFILIGGEDMKKVDVIEGIIAFDGAQDLELGTSEKSVKLENIALGMYRFSLSLEQKDIQKGTILAHFHKNTEQKLPISLTDTQFVSLGERYDLSNIVE